VKVFVQSVVDTSDLDDRVRDFNYAVEHALYQAHEADSRVQVEFSGRFFSLTLRAPVTLELDGMPTARPEPSDIGVSGAVRVRSWARTSVVGGWNAAARLPHRTRLAVQAGAVYLFYAPSEVKENELTQQLEALEIQGIGTWRERGLGQVTVCAPFHTVLAR
jgi:CRISPR-associated protein Csx10